MNEKLEAAKEQAIAHIMQEPTLWGLEEAIRYAFNAGYAAATVPADEEVREAIDVVIAMQEDFRRKAVAVVRDTSLRTLWNEKADALRTLIATVSGDGWIPVDERLPSEDGSYLVADSEDFMYVAYFQTRQQRFLVLDKYVEDAIASYWKRIDSPKGDEQKEQK